MHDFCYEDDFDDDPRYWEDCYGIDPEDDEYHPDHPYQDHYDDQDDQSVVRWFPSWKTSDKIIDAAVVFPVMFLYGPLNHSDVSLTGIYTEYRLRAEFKPDVMYRTIDNMFEIKTRLYENFSIDDLYILIEFIQPRTEILLKVLPGSMCVKILRFFYQDLECDEIMYPLIDQLVKCYSGYNGRILGVDGSHPSIFE